MRKKTSTKVLCVFMAFLFVFGMLNMSNANFGIKASAVNKTVLSGDISEGWVLYSDGELRITQNISSDSDGIFPWTDKADKITTVSIGNEVTVIANYSFAGTSVKEIYIPATVTKLSVKAFYNRATADKAESLITSLQTIYYGGSYDEFVKLNSGIEETNIYVEYGHQHRNTSPEEIKPDCKNEKDGYSGDIYCKDCHALVEEGQVIPYAKAHVWPKEKELYKAATCEEGADNYNNDLYAFKCTLCGAWKDVEPRAHVVEHKYTIVETRSDIACGTEGATYTAKCSVCGNLTEKTLPKTHDYVTNLSSKAPTCTQDGVLVEECRYCTSVKSETKLSRTGHGEKRVEQKEATCTTPGYIDSYCTVCNQKVGTKYIAAFGHNFSKDWTVITKPTHAKEGLKKKLCQNKGCEEFEESAVIPVHTYGFYEETGYKYVTTTPETCKTAGVKTFVCTKCFDECYNEAKASGDSELEATRKAAEKAKIYNDEGAVITQVIPVNNSAHTPLPVPEEPCADYVEATCEKDGYIITRCEICGLEINRKVLPAKGHKYELDVSEERRVDCTEGGGKAYMVCQTCGQEYTIIVPSNTEHKIEKQVHEATCTEKGYTVEVCSVPGCCYKIGPVGVRAALGHSKENSQWELVEEATCTKDGKKVRKCVRYGENGCTEEDIEVIPATGHKYITKTEAATCTKEGRKYKICVVCNQEADNEVLPTIAHDNDEVVTAPTCNDKGYTTYTCKVCGLSSKDKWVDALGHAYDDGVTVKPTCLEDGYIIKTCTRCGFKDESNKIPSGESATGHKFVDDEAVAPTCTTTGLTAGSHCENCGFKQVPQETIPAKGHTIEILAKKAPTCDEPGLTEGKKCTTCKETLVAQEEIHATGHDIRKRPAVEATCTNSGLTEGEYCATCSKTLKEQETVAMKPHTLVIDAAVEATCTSKGLTAGSHCSVCKAVLVPQNEVAMKQHTKVIDDAVAPTCEKDGLTAGSHCSVCQNTIEKQEVVPATGHNYVDDHVNTEATPFGEGEKVQKCSKCGAEQVVKYKLTFIQSVTYVFKKAGKIISNIFGLFL